MGGFNKNILATGLINMGRDYATAVRNENSRDEERQWQEAQLLRREALAEAKGDSGYVNQEGVKVTKGEYEKMAPEQKGGLISSSNFATQQQKDLKTWERDQRDQELDPDNTDVQGGRITLGDAKNLAANGLPMGSIKQQHDAINHQQAIELEKIKETGRKELKEMEGNIREHLKSLGGGQDGKPDKSWLTGSNVTDLVTKAGTIMTALQEMDPASPAYKTNLALATSMLKIAGVEVPGVTDVGKSDGWTSSKPGEGGMIKPSQNPNVKLSPTSRQPRQVKNKRTGKVETVYIDAQGKMYSTPN